MKGIERARWRERLITAAGAPIRRAVLREAAATTTPVTERARWRERLMAAAGAPIRRAVLREAAATLTPPPGAPALLLVAPSCGKRARRPRGARRLELELRLPGASAGRECSAMCAFLGVRKNLAPG